MLRRLCAIMIDLCKIEEKSYRLYKSFIIHQNGVLPQVRLLMALSAGRLAA